MMGVSDVQRDSLVRRIYNINEKDFEGVALEVWKYQYDGNPLYRSYCELLGVSPEKIRTSRDIPYLPIVMFRQHAIKTGDWEPEMIFGSSGTTGSMQSRHMVRDLAWYHAIAENSFTLRFGPPADFVWIGLLPSYLERVDSSLVEMVHYFMVLSNQPANRFFPIVTDDLVATLFNLKKQHRRANLIGVSFALLDLFETMDLPVWDQLLVIETGGMKGRGKEITREELYHRMRKHHADLHITSEYGMTELMSQAYRNGDYYQPGPAMRVAIRDISDPMQLIGFGQRGAINIMDLANIDTCAFIATDDIGIAFPDGRFDVLGRLDSSDLRGCNLLYV